MKTMLHTGLPLKFVNRGDDSVENVARRFDFVGFGIDAKKVLRARSANQDPANVTKIDFYAVHIFAVSDGKIRNFLALAIGEVGDGFFFLTGSYVEVDAGVIVFAAFFLKRGKEFTEGFAMPRHEFGEE